jgi:hypothetical protein
MWQSENEARTFARTRFRPDATAMPFDDASHGSEADSRATKTLIAM